MQGLPPVEHRGASFENEQFEAQMLENARVALQKEEQVARALHRVQNRIGMIWFLRLHYCDSKHTCKQLNRDKNLILMQAS